ncbi:MAG: hypothetical protein IJ532_02030 [Alphaproteobacteria bacterium]|nr:hypothetical protein [Alphaproteobacteria bacterium]
MFDWLFNKNEDELAASQVENADSINLDLRVKEGVTLLVSSLINEYVPTQNSPTLIKNATTSIVNYVMSDYKGGLNETQILAKDGEKLFLPQPAMLAHWAESKGFKQLPNNENKLSAEDVSGKYVLTYYPPMTESWAKRTTDNIDDTTNKHWYSHCKSSIYDVSGNPIASANPEAAYNDTIHDATAYVPEDSYSYVIDYQKLGLNRADIVEGFELQSAGINIMHPDIQKSVFRLKEAGMETDDIVALWNNKIDISNNKNINEIEKQLRDGKSKFALNTGNLVKSENNEYRYNLQDNSCAIQPTAPILYASEAKIRRESMTAEQADNFRNSIGLYNIHNPADYGKINKKFYDDYKNNVWENFKAAIKEDAKHLIQEPAETLTKLKDNAIGAGKWLSAKTMLWAPRAMEIVKTDIESVKNSLMQTLSDDGKKFHKMLSSLSWSNLVSKYFPKEEKPRHSTYNAALSGNTKQIER